MGTDNPAEALEPPPTAATGARVRDLLASLVERTSRGLLSLGQLSNLQVSVSLCSFVVHTQRWGGHRATRPTPDLPAPLEGMEAVTPAHKRHPVLGICLHLLSHTDEEAALMSQLKNYYECLKNNCFSLLSAKKPVSCLSITKNSTA